MDHALAHQIYAGCDMFLMPSQFEPCGLSQLIALRYGTVPIVRETGGLRDTVLSYNEYTDEGNGFSFFNYNAHDMLHTIERAVDYYHNHKDVWAKLQHRGMTGDYSWTNSAGKYMEMYKALVAGNGQKEVAAPTEPNPVVVEPAAEVTEPAVEEAPKAKKPRAPRKPKAEAETAEKPARKPGARKVKEAAPAEVPAEMPADAPAEAPAKKRGRKPKAAEEVAPAEKPAEAPVKKPRAPRKKKVEETPAE